LAHGSVPPEHALRALMQRVREARVTVANRITAEIGPGLLVLAAVASDDTDADRDWLARKIVSLRIFDDEAGVMNRSVADVGGGILAVSQFTLYASTKKGARPSWSAAAPPEEARPRFAAFVDALARASGHAVATGEFGATMQIALVNDGPVTIWIDTRERE
jgi:D-tyrosyl-tRNA(Tyr) deacylase